MLRTLALYPLCREPSGTYLRSKSVCAGAWPCGGKGTLLAHNGCQDSAAAALESHGCFETVRWELREWTCDAADCILSWGPAGTEVDMTACFPELLC